MLDRIRTRSKYWANVGEFNIGRERNGVNIGFWRSTAAFFFKECPCDLLIVIAKDIFIRNCFLVKIHDNVPGNIDNVKRDISSNAFCPSKILTASTYCPICCIMNCVPLHSPLSGFRFFKNMAGWPTFEQNH